MEQTKNFADIFNTRPQAFPITSVPTNQCYTATIDEEFTHVSQFAPLVEILEQAVEGDVVQIRLTSPGGCVSSTKPLLSALDQTEAFVHVHVDADVASAGTFLIMKADLVTFSRYSSIMIHTASWGYGSHSGNMESSTAHYLHTVKALARDLYEDFLTEEEFEKMFNGLDLFFTPEQVHERLEARNKKRNAPPVEEPVKKPRAKRQALPQLEE